ncbi:hypothetical protein M4578_15515 [Salipiger sp. P9]|uniref:hypothetical protein n=1 Tax=Salipiger pentaromativorans TaxID=2943193 RepID=UPI002157DAA3|nr:hypothetical protein [Salipiger pentaromativorans]MCR8549246.1 hypothetical protein [Salipiger pentaromativorans]
MINILLKRRSFCAGLAGALVARPGWAATPAQLKARKATVQLAPEGYGPTEVWSYDGTIPGPLMAHPAGELVGEPVFVPC